MTYSPTTWADEVPGETPAKYVITDDTLGAIAASATIELKTAPASGTPVDATHLNNIEQGIVTLESDLADLQDQVDTGVPKIMTAKGDLAVATASNVAARLPVGSNNTILMADSAATPGVKWADRASGLLTAKGDLFTASAANTAARLAVGSSGQYLIPDSAEATGLKWATMITPARYTSTSWDGDDKAASTTYTLTLSTDFSFSLAAKMVLVWLAAKWSTINDSSEMYFCRPTDTSCRLGGVRGHVSNIISDFYGWVPVISGALTLKTGATAPSNVWVEISAYML